MSLDSRGLFQPSFNALVYSRGLRIRKGSLIGDSSLKVRIIWFIATVVMMLLSLSIAAASNTTTKFEAGPFNCSVDLNTPCHDIIISKPVHKEMMDGTGYVNYPVDICGVSITFTRYNKSNVFDVEKGVSTQSIFGDLISFGIDMNTIQLFPRIIDGRNGATGSASVTRLNSDVYDASYFISPRSVCRITVWGANNYNKMVSVLNTIHTKEAS